LPRVQGSCRGHIERYFFDPSTGTCAQFSYTGCSGNANNFESLADCQTSCQDQLIGPVAPVAAVTLPALINSGKETAKADNTDICTLPPILTKNNVSCFGFIPSWTYNAAAGQCQSYVYGGCGKTANLFSSQEECKAKCDQATEAARQAKRNACLLPTVHGPCFGFMKRYAFNQDKNRCELFTYGGCRGNGNNFKTADECFETCGGDLPCTDGKCEEVNCDMNLYQHYIEYGCRPEYKGNSCCPTNFHCPVDGDARSAPKQPTCHYRGVAYSVGDSVSMATEDNACRRGCTCQINSERPDKASIACAVIDCPQAPEGCDIPVYESDKCCPTYKCPDSDESSEEALTCTYEGKEYIKGQEIPTKNPCKSCRCADGFAGLDGPGCSDVRCIINSRPGCVPVYTDGVCCPMGYKCPEDAETASTLRVIHLEPEAGSQSGVSTLPILIPGGRKKWQVKAEHCLLPKETGPCRMVLNQFYYDADQGLCLPFVYGGCRGNRNRFDSEDDCYNACSSLTAAERQEENREKSAAGPFISVGEAATLPALIPTVDQGSQPKSPFITSGAVQTLPISIPGGRESWQVKDARCLAAKSVGKCKGIIPKFHYDADQQKCAPFEYSGCGGNDNQFDTEDECLNACKATSPVGRSIDLAAPANAQLDACQLPQISGPCRAAAPSYSYNSESGACEYFLYGGCRGNGNRFASEEECLDRCSNRTKGQNGVETSRSADEEFKLPEHCTLEAAVGPCRASKPRYFYNSAAGECQPFAYGGCRGNRNNFESVEECEGQCKNPSAAASGASSTYLKVGVQKEHDSKRSKCKLPADSGFCRAFQERFYYDSVQKKCATFSWGGCQGNANNFPTERECVAHCGRSHKPALLGRSGPVDHDVSQAVDEGMPDGSNNMCTFGNVTLSLGDRMEFDDACEKCVCSTPPQVTCTRQTCPTFVPPANAICTQHSEPGQCCPTSFSCVSANPPSIDVCEGINCPEGQQCAVKSQESEDGSWIPPIGVCEAEI